MDNVKQESNHEAKGYGFIIYSGTTVVLFIVLSLLVKAGLFYFDVEKTLLTDIIIGLATLYVSCFLGVKNTKSNKQIPTNKHSFGISAAIVVVLAYLYATFNNIVFYGADIAFIEFLFPVVAGLFVYVCAIIHS